MKTQLIFIHIPRTAGMFIRTYMKTHGESYQQVTRILSKRRMGPMDLDEKCFFTTTRHISSGALLDRGFISREWWDRSIKFTSVRNPWDRLVSVYYVIRKRKLQGYPSLRSFHEFAEHILSGKGQVVRPPFGYNRFKFNYAGCQVDWLKWGVDKILRFENLQEDLKNFCASIDIEYQPSIYKKRRPRKHYSHYYDDSLAERVGVYYQRDIDTFGYTFDSE